MKVSFDHYLDTEMRGTTEAWDTAKVFAVNYTGTRVQIDDGACTETNNPTNTVLCENLAWENKEYVIDSSLIDGNPIRIEFEFIEDGYQFTPDKGWFIDDVKIFEFTPNTAPTITTNPTPFEQTITSGDTLTVQVVENTTPNTNQIEINDDKNNLDNGLTITPDQTNIVTGETFDYDLATKQFTFTTPKNYTSDQTKVLKYKVTDNDGAETDGEITVQILRKNQTPTLSVDPYQTTITEPKVATITFGDENSGEDIEITDEGDLGNGLSLNVDTTGVTYGNATFDPATNTITYTPDGTLVAPNTATINITYTVTDSEGANVNGTIEIEVKPKETTPPPITNYKNYFANSDYTEGENYNRVAISADGNFTYKATSGDGYTGSVNEVKMQKLNTSDASLVQELSKITGNNIFITSFDIFDNQLYVVGTSDGGVSYNGVNASNKYFILRINLADNSAIAHSFDHNNAYLVDVVADNNGNTFVSLHASVNICFGGNAANQNICILPGNGSDILLKLDQNLKPVWAKNVTNRNGQAGTYGLNYIEVDQSGNIYMTGNFNDGSLPYIGGIENKNPERNSYLVKYNTNGDVVWAKNLLSGKGENRAYGIAKVPGKNEIAVTGFLSGTAKALDDQNYSSAGSSDVYVTKVDYDGNHVKTIVTGGDKGETVILDGLKAGKDKLYFVGYNFSGDFKIGDTEVPAKGAWTTFVAELSTDLDIQKVAYPNPENDNADDWMQDFDVAQNAPQGQTNLAGILYFAKGNSMEVEPSTIQTATESGTDWQTFVSWLNFDQ